jgi:predicted nucleotidyltransferase
MNGNIMTDEVAEALENVYKVSSPVSIFIYGSRARKDFKPTSDYEVGAIYLKDKKPRRSEIAKLHSVKGLNIYPFVLEELKEYNLDTPFPKAIYMKELIGAAKTVLGEEILEKMAQPEIRLSDLIERTAFDVATAFAAYRSFGTKDWVNVAINFKSVLFGARVLEIYELKKFEYSYDDIVKLSGELDLEEEYKQLINHASDVRKGKPIIEQFLFTNITFLNQRIAKKIRADFASHGDKVIMPGRKIKW